MAEVRLSLPVATAWMDLGKSTNLSTNLEMLMDHYGRSLLHINLD